MTDTTTKVLEVVVDNNKAIASISEYNRLIDEQKQKQRDLSEAFKSGTISEADYYKAIAKSKEEVKAYTRSMQELSKEVQNNIKDAQEQDGSLRGLRAQLSNLTKEFDALSRAERNGEAGRAKMAEINRITNELKEAEEETQRFYRNVGNYPDVKPLETQLGDLKKALAQLKYEGKDNTEEFAAMAQQASAMKDAIADVEQQVNATASDTKNLDTAMQGLSVAMGGMMLLGNLFEEGSEEAKKFNEIMMSLQKIMMVLNTLRAIQNATQKQGLLAQAVENARLKIGNTLKVIETKVTQQATGATVAQTIAQKALNLVMKASPVMWLVGGVAALTGAYALFSDSSEETTDDLEEQQKRMEALTKAVERQREVLDKYVETLQAVGASDAEQLYARLQRIADLMIDTKWGDDKTALAKLFNEANNEALQFVKTWQALGEKMENQKGWSEARKEIEAARVEMESQLALIQRFHQQAIPGYAAADYAAAINYVESVYDEALAKYQEKQQAAALAIVKAETDLLRKVTDERIALIEDENERALETEEVRHARAIDDLETRLETEKNLTEKQRLALNELIELEEQKHQQKLLDINNKAQEERRKADEKALADRIAAANKETQAMMDLVKQDWENRINEAANKGQQTLQMEIDAAKARMDALQQLEGESDAEFKAKQLAAEREYIDAKKALNDYELEIEQAKYDALSGMVGGLSSIMEAFGEENEALAKASKIIALGEIAVSTGKALAAGIAQASATGPWPANIAAIGTTVTTILANIASAISTVKSAKFATGGLVTGPGSSTSDSIPAQLSNGESVMNAKTTSMFGPLLSSLNQAGGGIAFNPGLGGQREGYEFLASAVAAGMKRVNLRVGVDEVTRVQNRVADIQEISTIE
jgi:hypothetical protein